MFGTGIIKGMLVTLKAFLASYFKGPHEGGIFTVEYPEKRLAEKERFRNFPFLLYDQTPENLRCVACDICAKECPPKCIYIVRDFDKEGRPLKRPAIFDIDFTVCMNCGICEEACPFDAIFMDHEFEIAGPDRQNKMLYHRDDLLKSNEYFNKIRPTDAGAIDARRREAEEKKKAAAAQAVKAKTTQPQPEPPKT
ncbi:MAG: 4Fe-4S binding protein [Candidatus Omnitrophica bacterium]|nr:4Fe-4S binding protein [Candidatus Omnitrophota bacterium]